MIALAHWPAAARTSRTAATWRSPGRRWAAAGERTGMSAGARIEASTPRCALCWTLGIGSDSPRSLWRRTVARDRCPIEHPAPDL